jgi:hypothetical protein
VFFFWLASRVAHPHWVYQYCIGSDVDLKFTLGPISRLVPSHKIEFFTEYLVQVQGTCREVESKVDNEALSKNIRSPTVVSGEEDNQTTDQVHLYQVQALHWFHVLAVWAVIQKHSGPRS